MKVSIIGTGYVGLPTGVGLAELGHDVTCIDREKSKIEPLQKGEMTLYEEGLEELLKRNLASKKIKFSTTKTSVSEADVVMIAVATPPHPVTKEADMKYVHAAAIEIAEHIKDYTVVVIKSTVPVGTADDVEALIKKTNPNADFDVVSLPEFLREGFAVHDFFNPDRIVIGAETERAKEVINKLYAPLASKTTLLFVARQSSELIKYASNSFLAMKIHYINEMSDFCRKTKANIKEVAQGMGLDSRIGSRFLNPGPGYGGSCFPKDTLAMAYMARMNDVEMTLVEATIKGNAERKRKMAERILDTVKDGKSAKIAVLGLAFKNGTDDCRDSPAMEIIQAMLEQNPNVKITAYDPQAMENAKLIMGDQIKYAKSMYDAVKGADALAILTEWPEFTTLDLSKTAELMAQKNILDFRNSLDPNDAKKNGFSYECIGRAVVQ